MNDKRIVTGRLARWNADRGFGFLEPDDGSEDVFVHVYVCPDGGELAGWRLCCTVEHGARGPRAIACDVLSAPEGIGPPVLPVETRDDGQVGDAYPDQGDSERPARRW